MSSKDVLLQIKKAGFPNEVIDSVLEKGTLMKVRNQEILAKEGVVCKSMFLILKGGFVSQHVDEISGDIKTVNFFLDSFSQIMTSPKSYHSGLIAQVRLKAIKESEVLIVQKKDIDYDITYRTNPVFKDFYIKCLIDQLLLENEFKTQIITKSSKQLYHYLITKYPVIIQTFPSKNIAEFMGISQEWLSKLKGRLIY